MNHTFLLFFLTQIIHTFYWFVCAFYLLHNLSGTKLGSIDKICEQYKNVKVTKGKVHHSIKIIFSIDVFLIFVFLFFPYSNFIGSKRKHNLQNTTKSKITKITNNKGM